MAVLDVDRQVREDVQQFDINNAAAVISGSRRAVSVRQLRRMLRVSYRAALIMSRRIKHTMARDRAA